MWKLNVKLPFGARMKANVASQSCSSRLSENTWLANSLRVKSYVVAHCADHFSVMLNERLDCAFCCGGVTKNVPPPVVDCPAPPLSVVFERCCRHWSYSTMSLMYGWQSAVGSTITTPEPVGGRVRCAL